MSHPLIALQTHPPWGLRARSSTWFTTFVVGFGVATDLLVYSIVIPVLPFRLESDGYTDVSGRVGWILFSYSGGLVVSTIPVAILTERFNLRKWPLIAGLFALLGSQVLLMEAPRYWVMCLARVIQGVSSSVVWVVGLALLCDNSPELYVGRQLGIAMMGLSIGLLIGPSVGGALYARFGFHGPFIFSIIFTAFDLLGRLLIIERKEALRWGIDPKTVSGDDKSNGTLTNGDDALVLGDAKDSLPMQEITETEMLDTLEKATQSSPVTEDKQDLPRAPSVDQRLSLLGVLGRLVKSPRAIVALFITFIYGIVFSAQEPVLPIHLQWVWGLDSTQIGLVFLAAVVPTLLSSPLSGYYADRNGSEWVAPICLVLSLPWWVVLLIQDRLALFVVAFAFENLFTSGMLAPVMAELAIVSRNIEGVGYGHVYGAFNLAYGVGTSAGPIIGGQIYDGVAHGWTALCLISTGLLCLCLLLAFFFTGEKPLSKRLARLSRFN